MCAAMGDHARRLQAALAGGQSVAEPPWLPHRQRDWQGMIPHHGCRFGQAALRLPPAPEQKRPVLDDHGHQLGQDFAHEAMRVGAADVVNMPVAFPQLDTITLPHSEPRVMR